MPDPNIAAVTGAPVFYQDLEQPHIPEEYLTEAVNYHQSLMDTEFKGKHWEQAYRKQQVNHSPKYMGMMGTNLEHLTTEYEVQKRIMLRTGITLTPRIPDEYRALWSALMEIDRRLINETNRFREETSIYNRVMDHCDSKLSNEEKNEIEAYCDAISEYAANAYTVSDFLLDRLISNIHREGLPWDKPLSDIRELLEKALEGTGYTPEDVLRLTENVCGHLLPPSLIPMQVQAGIPSYATEFLNQPDPSLVPPFAFSDRSREFAVQNFDAAFQTAFSPDGYVRLFQDGRDVFDQIYVGGKNIRELYGEETDSMSDFDAMEHLKCRAMFHILKGDSVHVVPLDWNGSAELLPIVMTTDCRELSDSIKRAQENRKSLTANDMHSILLSQRDLNLRTRIQKRKAQFHIENTRPLYPDMNAADHKRMPFKLPEAPEGFQGDYYGEIYRLYEHAGKMESLSETNTKFRELGSSLFAQIVSKADIAASELMHPIYKQMGIASPADLFFIDGKPAIDYLTEKYKYSRNALIDDHKLLYAEIAAHITSGQHSVHIAQVGMDERGGFTVGVKTLQPDLTPLKGREHFYQKSRSTKANSLYKKDDRDMVQDIQRRFSEQAARTAAHNLSHEYEPSTKAYREAAALLQTGGPMADKIFDSFFTQENKDSLTTTARHFRELNRGSLAGSVMMAQIALMAGHPEIRYADLMNPDAFRAEKRAMGQRLTDALEKFHENPSDPRPLASINADCMRAIGNFNLQKELLYFLGQPEDLPSDEMEALLKDPKNIPAFNTLMGRLSTFGQSAFQIIKTIQEAAPKELSPLTPREMQRCSNALSSFTSFLPFSQLRAFQSELQGRDAFSDSQLKTYQFLGDTARSLLVKEGQLGNWPKEMSAKLQGLFMKAKESDPNISETLATPEGILKESQKITEERFEAGAEQILSSLSGVDLNQLEHTSGIHTLNRPFSAASIAYGFMLARNGDMALENFLEPYDEEMLKKAGEDFVNFVLTHPAGISETAEASEEAKKSKEAKETASREQRIKVFQAYAPIYEKWEDRLIKEPLPDIDYKNPMGLVCHLGKLTMMMQQANDLSQSEEGLRGHPEYLNLRKGEEYVNHRGKQLALLQSITKAAVQAAGVVSPDVPPSAKNAEIAVGTYMMEKYGSIIRGKNMDELIQSIKPKALNKEYIEALVFFSMNQEETARYVHSPGSFQYVPGTGIVERSPENIPRANPPEKPARRRLEGGFNALKDKQPASSKTAPQQIKAPKAPAPSHEEKKPVPHSGKR